MNYRNVNRKMVAILSVIGVLFALQGAACQIEPDIESVSDTGPPLVPKDGFVPSEGTAVKIAEAILVPIFGDKAVAADRPFKASLNGGVWTVTGTMPPRHLGGTAVVKLSKRDGRILSVIHEE